MIKPDDGGVEKGVLLVGETIDLPRRRLGVGRRDLRSDVEVGAATRDGSAFNRVVSASLSTC